MSTDYGNLLIVDRDHTVYDVLKDHLELYGYTVFGANDRDQALAMLQALECDMMLLAPDLPDKESLQVLQDLKEDQTLRSIPVLIVAAELNVNHLEECLILGAEDYIDPSGSMLLLRARIRTHLDKARLCNQLLVSPEKEVLFIKLERDLQIGHDIQSDFLPKELPPCHGWDIAHKYKPAREVGGDLYDVFMIPEDNLIGLIIGDVCDKGVGAALFMAVFRSLFRAAVQKHYGFFADRSTMDAYASQAFSTIGTTVLKSAFNLVNNYVIDNHHERGYFVTLFFGVLEPSTGSLLYVNGGHVPILLLDRNGVKARLTASGPAVGLISNSPFEIQQIQIEPGEILFTYTDGVTDARDPSRQFFGEHRLVELVSQPATSATDLIERVDTTLVSHIASAEQYDDITMLVVGRTC